MYRRMNESALYQISMLLDAYSDIIAGIFVVKGMSHQSNSMVWKMNLDVEGRDYANKLRMLLMNLVHTSQQLGLIDLDKITFDLNNQCLILRKLVKSKGKAPLFISIITTEKTVDLQTVDMIVDQLAEELQFLL